MHDYKSEMLKSITPSFIVIINADEALTAIGCAIPPFSALLSNRCVMATFFNSLPSIILDRRLPKLLVVSSDLDADITSPASSTTPKIKGATENFALLDAIMADQVDRGWLSRGSERPHYWPEHLSSESCVPKPGTDNFCKVGYYGHLRVGKDPSALCVYSVPLYSECRIGSDFVQSLGNSPQIGALVGIRIMPFRGLSILGDRGLPRPR